MKELKLETKIERCTDFCCKILKYYTFQTEEDELIHIDKNLKWVIPAPLLYSVIEIDNKAIYQDFKKHAKLYTIIIQEYLKRKEYLDKVLYDLECRIIKIREICKKCNLFFKEYKNLCDYACRVVRDENVSNCELSKKKYEDLRFFTKIQFSKL